MFLKKILVIFNNIRGYKNIESVLDELSEIFEINLIFIPFTFDPSSLDTSDVKFKILKTIPVKEIKLDNTVIQNICSFAKHEIRNVSLILLTDIQNFPGAALYSPIKKIYPKTRVIGFQHGLFQIWNGHWFNRLCDFYMAFGKEFTAFYPQYRRGDIVYSGIPKLDGIKDIKTEDQGYILYIGQKEPAPEIVNPFLLDLENTFRKKVVVRNHPQYPDHYKTSRSNEEYANENLWDQIANSSFVITTHSTCIVEGLLIGKKVIIMPDHISATFKNYEWRASEYTANSVKRILIEKSDWDYLPWLKNTITTLDFNSTKTTRDALLAISGLQPSRNWVLFFKSYFSEVRFFMSFVVRAKNAFLRKFI